MKEKRKVIEVKPAKSEQEVDIIFKQHGIATREGAMAMKAVENGKEVGSAAFTMIGNELTLLSVIYPKDDIYVCDLVSRAVMNYGVNRGAMYCELAEKAPVKEFLTLGFIKSTDETSVNIIKTFTMCTNCKKNK